jgi:hypothetical protein
MQRTAVLGATFWLLHVPQAFRGRPVTLNISTPAAQIYRSNLLFTQVNREEKYEAGKGSIWGPHLSGTDTGVVWGRMVLADSDAQTRESKSGELS